MLTKSIFILLIFSLFKFDVFSQTVTPKLIITGQAGMIFSSLIHGKSPFAKYDYKTEFINKSFYGYSIRYRLTKKLWIAAGYNKGVLGTKVRYEYFTEDEGYAEHKFWYLDLKNTYSLIPIFFEYRNNKKINLIIQLGGYIGFLKDSYVGSSSESLIATNGLASITLSQGSVQGRKYTNNTDIGIMIGTGVSVPFTKRLNFLLNPSVMIGLKKLDALHDNDSQTYIYPSVVTIHTDYFGLNSRSKNVAFFLSAGISYTVF